MSDLTPRRLLFFLGALAMMFCLGGSIMRESDGGTSIARSIAIICITRSGRGIPRSMKAMKVPSSAMLCVKM